ncbi:MAG: tripartite tricarboxylate transporter TctB family protein [Hyphomicrobiaceae bacterium]
MANGERILAASIGLFGIVWIWQSRRLTYWGEFAPDAGFLPFWLGGALVVLSAVFLIGSFRQTPPVQQLPTVRRSKAPAIALGLFACIALLEWLGFVAAIALYLVFLIGVVERRSPVETLTVPPISTFALWLVFGWWLRVPLPKGPWGF